jgi:chaperone required for assembly of F1-ATPase
MSMTVLAWLQVAVGSNAITSWRRDHGRNDPENAAFRGRFAAPSSCIAATNRLAAPHNSHHNTGTGNSSTPILPMRDIFEDIFENQPLDPMESARRNMRPNLRTRFYQDASAGGHKDAGVDGFAVLLDGRPVRSPARKLVAAPKRELAQAIADEWQAQDKVVDPAAMPLTRLANSIIDGVIPAPEPVAAEIEKFLGTDMLFYRAPEPEGLVALQRRRWDPVIEWARDAFGARFVLAEGVVHVEQPVESLAKTRAVISANVGDTAGAWRLGALHVATALTGSALLALALAAGRLSPDDAWTAAHVDEDWNMDFWGSDELALDRRAFRRKEFDAAALVLAALRN